MADIKSFDLLLYDFANILQCLLVSKIEDQHELQCETWPSNIRTPNPLSFP